MAGTGRLADERCCRRGDDRGVAVFGRVESGLDISDQLLARPTGSSDEAYPEAVRQQIFVLPIPIRVQRG